MSTDMSMMTDMAISSATQPSLGLYSQEGMALRKQTDPEQKEKELREASQGFEAIFLQKMWEEMRASMPENSMHGSKEEKYWQSMYAQYLGEEMAQNGGIGLADMMMEQLTKEKVSSPSSARLFDRAPMSVEPAPLLAENALPMNDTEQAVRDGKISPADTRGFMTTVPVSNTNTVSETTNVHSVENASEKTNNSHSSDDLYEELGDRDHTVQGSLNQGDINPAQMGAMAHTNQTNTPVEPMVTTTRTETNGAGRTTTRTISMPLSEYQAKNGINPDGTTGANSTNINSANRPNTLNGANTQNTTQNTAQNPHLEAFGSEPVIAQNYAQASEALMVQNAMARAGANSGNAINANAPQESALVRQTLDELQAQANTSSMNAGVVASTGTTTEPIVIHTTYRSNLPASERNQAILDKNGQLSKQHQQVINEQIARQHEAQRAEHERALYMAGGVGALGGLGDEINEYPEDLINPQADTTANNTQNTDLAQQAQATEAVKQSNDPLAGIQTRYVSPIQTLMQEARKEFERKREAEELARLDGSAHLQAVADVQSQIDKLMTRENKEVYLLANTNPMSSMLASSTQINSHNDMMSNSGHNTAINNTAMSPVLMASSELDTNSVLPVYRTMPSLDTALRSGNLIASLSPEEIRMTQFKPEPLIETARLEENALGTQATEENIQFEQVAEYRHAGGPNFAQPEDSYPLGVNAVDSINGTQYVSGVSPSMQMQSPIANAEINSAFGWRLDPFTNERAWHTGIDIKAEEGSSVQVAASGKVIFAGEDPNFGNTIIVEHENGMQSLYGHNASLLVKEGEEISSGTNIATVGATGRSSGAHLHFEVRHNGLAINPEPYLMQNNA